MDFILSSLPITTFCCIQTYKLRSLERLYPTKANPEIMSLCKIMADFYARNMQAIGSISNEPLAGLCLPAMIKQ